MRLFSLGCLMLITSLSMAQSRFPALDKSPMDMSYYPQNYPILKIQDKATDPLLARVVYSRPQKNGRNVFGELLEYGNVWRLGANEATEVEFFKDMLIGNKLVPKGRYTLYAIPNQDKWTIIVNKETDIWGAFKYDSNQDVVRVDVPVQKLNDPLEAFSMVFEKSGNGFVLTAGWDTMAVSLPIAVYEKPAKKTTKKGK
ncbi:MAG: DUF2911 domain-containing protein [Bacteroidetes bacterium]|nr:DUF2911 domain-containing protein [Bacteroidota bacterium]